MKYSILTWLLIVMTALAPRVEAVAAEDEVQIAITSLAQLPDPAAEQSVNDFIARASPDEISQLMTHIAVAVVRPARQVVNAQLQHREPLVQERALRALAAIGFDNEQERKSVEAMLQHTNERIAMQAAVCLGTADDMRAVPALVEGLGSANEKVRASCQSALKRLTRADHKDKAAWMAWYDKQQAEIAERLKAISDRLNSPDKNEQIVGIQALGSSLTDRVESIALLEPMLKSEHADVQFAARQALATLAPQKYSMPSAAELSALIKVDPPPAKSGGVIDYLAAQGFFDTWLGLLTTVVTVIAILAFVLFLLRTPPVKNVTRRIAKVVVAGTRRIVRPVTNRIKRGTDRIAKALAAKHKSGDSSTS